MNQIWYLSPSNQSENMGINGYGSEQSQMYLLVDAITPHLDRCGVSFHVADRDMTLAQRCTASNKMGAAYHLALHSNAGGKGQAWGPIAFYYSAGKELSEEMIRQLLALGQENNRYSNVQQNSTFYELRKTNAPACLLEVDFHDSAVGVTFLTTRRKEIAEAIAKAIVSVDKKQWVDPPVQEDDAMAEVISLGLLDADSHGNHRWQDYMTREEAAMALLRLKKALQKGFIYE